MESLKSIEDIINSDPNLSRHVPSNPRNYSNMELTKRKELVDELEKKFPNIPPSWLEMCYDWLHGKTDEELTKMVNEHKITPPAPRDIKAGSITVEKYTPTEEDLETLKHQELNYSRELAFEAQAAQ